MDNEYRDKVIVIRVSSTEKEGLKANAKTQGLTLSKYLRDK